MQRAVMTLSRSGVESAPVYRVITWYCYDTLTTAHHEVARDMDAMVDGKLVFAAWDAPCNKARYIIPERIQERAAAQGLRIKI